MRAAASPSEPGIAISTDGTRSGMSAGSTRSRNYKQVEVGTRTPWDGSGKWSLRGARRLARRSPGRLLRTRHAGRVRARQLPPDAKLRRGHRGAAAKQVEPPPGGSRLRRFRNGPGAADATRRSRRSTTRPRRPGCSRLRRSCERRPRRRSTGARRPAIRGRAASTASRWSITPTATTPTASGGSTARSFSTCRSCARTG